MLPYEAKLLKHLEGGEGIANVYFAGKEGTDKKSVIGIVVAAKLYIGKAILNLIKMLLVKQNGNNCSVSWSVFRCASGLEAPSTSWSWTC